MTRSFMKGQQIYEKGNCVEHNGNFIYKVLSTKSFTSYDVSYKNGGCDCLAFLYSGKICKHWWAAHFYFLANQHQHVSSHQQSSPSYSPHSPLMHSPVRELRPIPFRTLSNKDECKFCAKEDELVACEKCGDEVCSECLCGLICFSCNITCSTNPIPFHTLSNKGDCQFCGKEDELVACEKCGDKICSGCLCGQLCFSCNLTCSTDCAPSLSTPKKHTYPRSPRSYISASPSVPLSPNPLSTLRTPGRPKKTFHKYKRRGPSNKQKQPSLTKISNRSPQKYGRSQTTNSSSPTLPYTPISRVRRHKRQRHANHNSSQLTPESHLSPVSPAHHTSKAPQPKHKTQNLQPKITPAPSPLSQEELDRSCTSYLLWEELVIGCKVEVKYIVPDRWFQGVVVSKSVFRTISILFDDGELKHNCDPEDMWIREVQITSPHRKKRAL